MSAVLAVLFLQSSIFVAAFIQVDIYHRHFQFQALLSSEKVADRHNTSLAATPIIGMTAVAGVLCNMARQFSVVLVVHLTASLYVLLCLLHLLTAGCYAHCAPTWALSFPVTRLWQPFCLQY